MPKLDCGDVAIDYTVDGVGPPLVFVHGAFADRSLWRRQVPCFAERHRVVTYDLRGHGATGPSPGRRYDVELFADDLTRLMDGLGLEGASFVGASLGGMIAQAFAARHPERVRALFLLSSFADTTEPVAELPSLDLVPNWLAAFTIRAWGRKRFAEFCKRRAAEIEGMSVPQSHDGELPMVRIDPAELPKIFKSLFTFRAAPPRGLAAPVMVASGEREHPRLKEQSRKLAALYGVPLTEIPAAGHIASLEATEAFNALLVRFLNEA